MFSNSFQYIYIYICTSAGWALDEGGWGMGGGLAKYKKCKKKSDSEQTVLPPWMAP